MRRLISTGVTIRGPIPLDAPLYAQKPTQAEMQDAHGRLTRELNDMFLARTAGADGWVMEGIDMRVVGIDDGSLVLRGDLVISRPD